MKALGLVFSDMYQDGRADDSFTGDRTLAAVHFAGRYRLIDFVLSNMANSGIYHIGVMVRSRYQSLMGHIGSGKDWDLSRKGAGIMVLPPYVSDEKTSSYRGRMDALYRVRGFIQEAEQDYVILTDCNVLHNIDYRDVIEAHEKSCADITAVYTKKAIDTDEKNWAITYDLYRNGRVHEILLHPDTTGVQYCAMNTWVMRTNTLLQMVASAVPSGRWDFVRDVLAPSLHALKVIGYEFRGYSAHICSLNSYFKHSMEMLDAESRNSLFYNEGRSIFTSVRDSSPTKYGSDAKVIHSLVADGCVIEGQVENSIIFRNVHVKKGAVVKNSVLLQGTVVEKDAMLQWIICDKNVVIQEGRNLLAYETQPFYIPKGKIV